MTPVQAQALSNETINQASCDLWFRERRWRLTASRFGEITKLTERRDMEKLCDSVISPIQINSPSLTHGRSNEGAAIRQYEEVITK